MFRNESGASVGGGKDGSLGASWVAFVCGAHAFCWGCEEEVFDISPGMGCAA